MTSLVLAAAVLAAAATATYLFCVRPMRRGTCPTMGGRVRGQDSGCARDAAAQEQISPAERAQLDRLRQQIARLRESSPPGTR